MDKITEEQEKVISELRRRMIEYVTPKMLEDDTLFYRFSKARDFILEEAETMLRKHIAWRKEYQIDTILTDYDPPEVLVKYVASSFICYDKEECVVRMNDAGRIDFNGLLNVVPRIELLKYFAFVMERDREKVIKKNKHGGIFLYNLIYNFEELSYSKVISLESIQFAVYYLKVFFDHYPETLRSVSVINAPSFFSWAFAAIKPVLPDSINKKMRIYGTDGWKEDLLKSIDADNLPSYLGGNKTDPDGNPLGKTLINYGRIIPKSYYMNKKFKKLSLEPDVQKITVMPLSKEEISFEVNKNDSSLEWEFETKTKDINFSLVFREESWDTNKTIELIPQQRIDTQNESEKGYFKCEKAGSYTIIFDNSHSWLHSKEVYFRARLCLPVNGD